MPNGWLQLAHKTAIVTGASSGIGQAVTQALYDAGCSVVMADKVIAPLPHQDLDRNIASSRPIALQPQEHTANSSTGGGSSSAISPPQSPQQPTQLPLVRFVQCDVTNRAQVQALMASSFFSTKASPVSQSLPPVGDGNVLRKSNPDALASSQTPIPIPSILVNCAGITRDGWMEKLTADDWDCVIDVNLKGTFNTCQSFLQHRSLWFQRYKQAMATEAPGIPDSTVQTIANVAARTEPESTSSIHNNSINSNVSIVNIGSVVGEYGNIGQVHYAASKGGVVSLTKALAKEVALASVRHDRYGLDGRNTIVRVNAVLPGFINTPMVAKVPNAILQRMVQEQVALQRLGTAAEVANVVAFLASERSSYVTGTTIECSGMIAL